MAAQSKFFFIRKVGKFNYLYRIKKIDGVRIDEVVGRVEKVESAIRQWREKTWAE